MSTHGRRLWSVAVSITLVFLFLAVLLLSAPTWGQASYTAQIRGVVKDQRGAVADPKKVLVDAAEAMDWIRSYLLLVRLWQRERTLAEHNNCYLPTGRAAF